MPICRRRATNWLEKAFSATLTREAGGVLECLFSCGKVTEPAFGDPFYTNGKLEMSA
jgi:hypothetical protein